MSSEKVKNAQIITRLKLFAKQRFGSISQLSTEMGRSTGYFNSYFHNGTLPGMRVLRDLEPLGLNLHWLETGEGDMMIQGAAPLVRESEVRYSADESRPCGCPEFEDVRIDLLWNDAARFSQVSQKWEDLDVGMRKLVVVKISRFILDIQIEQFINRPVEKQVKETENTG